MFDRTKCFCQGQCRADPVIKQLRAQAREPTHRNKLLRMAREAVLKAPRCPFTHGILGNILTNHGSPQYAEEHIHQAMALGDAPTQGYTNLGFCYIQMGMVKRAEQAFMSAIQANPNMIPAHVGLAKCADLNQDHERAVVLGKQVFDSHPDAHMIRVIYGKALASQGNIDAALAVMATGDCSVLFERGKIKERNGDYAGAWGDYCEANKATGHKYGADEADRRIANHRAFWGANRMETMPNVPNPVGKPLTPLFITGFPRSGTTLIETMLSGHKNIHPGDELKYIHELAAFSRSWLGASEDYPMSLAHMMFRDNYPILRSMKAYYIQNAMELHDPDKMYLTDKMPLNEMHLPFISMLFPESPIIHMRRNPMDIVLSNFSTYLTHGFNQSFDLVSSATHYAKVDRLLLHYVEKVEMNYTEVVYENMVADPEAAMRRIAEFCALPYEEATIHPELNKNHPRTPSYEAVKQPINSNSIGRWKKFEPYMGDALRILEPIMKREGY